jgi:hypothetical protein
MVCPSMLDVALSIHARHVDTEDRRFAQTRSKPRRFAVPIVQVDSFANISYENQAIDPIDTIDAMVLYICVGQIFIFISTPSTTRTSSHDLIRPSDFQDASTAGMFLDAITLIVPPPPKTV